MKNTSSSNRYSDAIFQIALQDNNLSEWGEFLNKISEILNLNHIKCHKNNYRNIIKNIENIDLNL